MRTLTVQSLGCYPIKSAEVEPCLTAKVGPNGLLHDRQLMVVDQAGKFISQRTEPKLATLRARILVGHVEMSGGGMRPLSIPLNYQDCDKVATVVCQDKIEAYDLGREAAGWLSDFLETPCRLVANCQDTQRSTVTPNGHPGFSGLADAYPILVTSQSSLDRINQALDRPISMDRFRPNVVVAGWPEFAENGWDNLRIGSVRLKAAAPCRRCKIIAVDQQTGKITHPQLLQILQGLNSGPNFGQYFIPETSGEINVGDEVTVLA